MFNQGWPHLGETLVDVVGKVVGQGRRALVMITYHYSRGNPHRGCAGFNYDADAARRHTFAIKNEVEAIFGAGHGTVYPLVCGFEADEEAIVIHGRDGRILNMAEVDDRAELLPLLLGNLDHIAEMRRTVRHLDVEHREWMICLGRGFDWLHMPNLALIIGPYSPDLADPIRKAAGFIGSNMQAGRIPEDGFLLLASAPYDEIGVDRARAVLKACFMRDFAAEVVAAEFPELAKK